MSRTTVLVLGDPGILQPLSQHFAGDYAVMETYPEANGSPPGITPDIILISGPNNQCGSRTLIWRIRSATQAPIILLSPDQSISACCESLRSGADDFLTIPVDCRELAARMQAILRRVSSAKPECCLRLRGGTLQISQAAREVRLNGKVVSLTPTEFDLLWALAANPGQPLSRERLHERVWGSCHPSSPRTVDSHMYHLRLALNDGGSLIETVFKVGYRLVE